MPREKLWQCLREYGVDEELLRAVQSLYDRCTARVRVNGLQSSPFTVRTGLRQGCALSPVLFLVFMDRIVMRCQRGEGFQLGAFNASRLLFVDDLALLAASQGELQRALDQLSAECEVDDMRVSPTKTVVMVVSREETDCIVHLNGTQLKQVTEFAYLGVLFTSDGRQDK